MGEHQSSNSSSRRRRRGPPLLNRLGRAAAALGMTGKLEAILTEGNCCCFWLPISPLLLSVLSRCLNRATHIELISAPSVFATGCIMLRQQVYPNLTMNTVHLQIEPELVMKSTIEIETLCNHWIEQPVTIFARKRGNCGLLGHATTDVTRRPLVRLILMPRATQVVMLPTGCIVQLLGGKSNL